MFLTYITGLSVKEYLKRQGISHRLLNTLKQYHCIICNGSEVLTNHILKTNDIVEVNLNYDEEAENIVSSSIPLHIIYEDESLLIVNKSPFIPVHPSIHYYETSLSNGVKYYFDQIGLKKKIRPVNRLDKDTTGIVIFAKNEYVQECLIKQMKEKKFVKEYVAIVDGILDEKKRYN